MNKSFAYNQNLPGYSKKGFQYLKAAFDSKKAQPRGINTRGIHFLFSVIRNQMLQLRQEGRQELSNIFNFKRKNILISVISESSK